MSAAASSDPLERALRWLAPAGVAVVLVGLFEAVAAGPDDGYNASRVAASVAMARGYPVLTGPDEGPALDYMYGPVAALAYLPAAWSPTPTGAIWVGVVAAFLFALAPVAWLCCARGGSGLTLPVLAVTGFGILCLHEPALQRAAFDIHADAPAIALAGAACAAVLASRGEPSSARLIAGAALAVLAVWTKQTALLIVPALPVLVWLRDGRRAGIRSALCMGAVGSAVSLLFVAWLGLERIVYTMIQIPGGHPFKPTGSDPRELFRLLAEGGASQPFADKLRALLQSAGRLALTAAPSGGLALAVTLALARGAPRDLLRRSPSLALLLVGVAMAPMAALGGAKLGGHTNAYAMTTWFFAAAAAVGFLDLARGADRRHRRIACAVLAGTVVLAAANELRSERRGAFAQALAQAREWRSNRIETAAAFARQHPEEAFFGMNPLIGLYADGVLYHSIAGLADRTLAGFAVGDELRRRHLPARMRFLALPDPGWFGMADQLPSGFDAFTIRYRGNELPGYRVWMLPPGAARR